MASGPAAGNSCTSQVETVSECSSCRTDGFITQWHRLVAAHDSLNDKIAAAVEVVQNWARTQPGMNPSDLHFALPGNVRQTLKGAVPGQVGIRDAVGLPSITRQRIPVRWTSLTTSTCAVISGDLKG